jgi:hypothetical protein
MKKIAPFVILLLFFLLTWNQFAHSSGFSFDIDGEEFDGPLATLLGLLFAGGGIVIATVVVLFVGAVLAVVFAGVGVLLVFALGLAALAISAAVSPLLLPILIPVAIIWFFTTRSRRNRVKEQAV